MTHWICTTCGQHFGDSASPPPLCPVCDDERQYVGWAGQAWTTPERLGQDHTIEWREDLGLAGLSIAPEFAIGQRALLIPDTDGCVMWDCIPLVTAEAVTGLQSRGGLKAVAVSHPHYYGAMADWSEALDGIPVYIHADDREWVTRPHGSIVYWTGETLSLSPLLTLVRCGGHFAGASVLHWSQGADGRGALFVGDVATVAMDRRHVSFMRSYPNFIPLNATTVRRIAQAVAPYRFDRIYGAWWDRNIVRDAEAAFARSTARYLAAIADPLA